MPPKGWRKNAAEICPECWPNGWPPNSSDAECVHGHWHRGPEAEEEA